MIKLNIELTCSCTERGSSFLKLSTPITPQSFCSINAKSSFIVVRFFQLNSTEKYNNTCIGSHMVQ